VCGSLPSISSVDAALIATFTALLAGLLTYMHSYRRHVQEYTFDILAPLLTNDRLVEGYYFLSIYMCERRTLNHDEMTDYERALMVQTLGYYEFLSSALLTNAIDRRTVLRQRSRHSFKAMYEVSRGFIDRRRALLGRPSVYSDFQTFVERYC
jgi:hypothetical protein